MSKRRYAARVTGAVILLAMQPALATIFEAEDATKNKGAETKTSSLNSNIKYVEFNDSSDKITFEVNAPAAGYYPIELSGAQNRGSGWNSTLDIVIKPAGGNETSKTHYFAPTNSAELFQERVVANVYLAQGLNTVALNMPWGHSLNVNYISIEDATPNNGGSDSGSTISNAEITATNAQSSSTASSGFPISYWTPHSITFDLSNVTSAVDSAILKVNVKDPTNNYTLTANADSSSSVTVTGAEKVEMSVTQFVNNHLGENAVTFVLKNNLKKFGWEYIDKTQTSSLQITTSGNDSGSDSGTSNQTPVASFTASTQNGEAPLAITFNASASHDPDNDPLSYYWNYGDGNTDTGSTASHSYQNAGDYTVKLTVNDGHSSSTAATRTISVTSSNNSGGGNTGGGTTTAQTFNFDGSAIEAPTINANGIAISEWVKPRISFDLSDISSISSAILKVKTLSTATGYELEATVINSGESQTTTVATSTSNTTATLDLTSILSEFAGQQITLELKTNKGPYNYLDEENPLTLEVVTNDSTGGGTGTDISGSNENIGNSKYGVNFNFLNSDATDSGNTHNGVSPFKIKGNDWKSKLDDEFSSSSSDSYVAADSNDVWKDVFINDPDLDIYSTVRVLNWHQTNTEAAFDNNNPHEIMPVQTQPSVEKNWAERVKRNTIQQDQHWRTIDKNGSPTSILNARDRSLAWEWIIDFANRKNKDLWITLPHSIIDPTLGAVGSYPHNGPDNDYARKLAILMKTGWDMGSINIKQALNDANKNLDSLPTLGDNFYRAAGATKTSSGLKPGLTLYVEYSNETWNTKFRQTFETAEYALQLHSQNSNNFLEGTESLVELSKEGRGAIVERAALYSAYSDVLIWQSFIDVFGNSSHLEKADQPTVKFVSSVHISNANYQFEKKNRIYSALGNGAAWNPNGLKPHVVATAPYFGNGLTNNSANLKTKIENSISAVTIQTKEFKDYLASTLPNTEFALYESGQHLENPCIAANLSHNMGEHYSNYLSSLDSIGIDLNMLFTFSGGYSKDGCWGIKNSLLEQSSPKYLSIKNHIKPQ